jgi:hypothetical protein
MQTLESPEKIPGNNKKKKKRNKKKKKAGECATIIEGGTMAQREEAMQRVIREQLKTKDEIALTTTPLKDKLGASL